MRIYIAWPVGGGAEEGMVGYGGAGAVAGAVAGAGAAACAHVAHAIIMPVESFNCYCNS